MGSSPTARTPEELLRVWRKRWEDRWEDDIRMNVVAITGDRKSAWFRVPTARF